MFIVNFQFSNRRGNTFIMFLKGERIGDCGNAINSKIFRTSGGNYTGVPSLDESLWKKIIGKPYSEKSRPAGFDEGELKTTDPIVLSRCVHQTVQKRLQPGASSLL